MLCTCSGLEEVPATRVEKMVPVVEAYHVPMDESSTSGVTALFLMQYV